MSKRNPKGRSIRGPFLAIPRAVLNSPAWAAMSGHEVKLLLDLAASYRGNNNGDLSCAWGIMQNRGWVSKETLARALAGIVAKGFVSLTRQGGRGTCSLYALTWGGIDDCAGKHDVRPWAVPSNTWRDWQPQKITAPATGVARPDRRGNATAKVVQLPRQAGQ